MGSYTLTLQVKGSKELKKFVNRLNQIQTWID